MNFNKFGRKKLSFAIFTEITFSFKNADALITRIYITSNCIVKIYNYLTIYITSNCIVQIYNSLTIYITSNCIVQIYNSLTYENGTYFLNRL